MDEKQNSAAPPPMPWNRGALRAWAIVGANHYRTGGVRSLFVAMTRDRLCIKAEGSDERAVFAELLRQAERLEAEGAFDRDGSNPAEADPNAPEKPENPLAKSLADLITPKQISFIVEAIREREGVADRAAALERADELALKEMRCKVEELSKTGAFYFIAFLRGETGAKKAPAQAPDDAAAAAAAAAAAPAQAAAEGSGAALKDTPATEGQKTAITKRKERLRSLIVFDDDELRKELAAVGCTIPRFITAAQAARFIERLDHLIASAERAAHAESRPEKGPPAK